MRGLILIIAIVGCLFFLNGCISGNAITEPIKTYSCPNGEVVVDIQKCQQPSHQAEESIIETIIPREKTNPEKLADSRAKLSDLSEDIDYEQRMLNAQVKLLNISNYRDCVKFYGQVNEKTLNNTEKILDEYIGELDAMSYLLNETPACRATLSTFNSSVHTTYRITKNEYRKIIPYCGQFEQYENEVQSVYDIIDQEMQEYADVSAQVERDCPELSKE